MVSADRESFSEADAIALAEATAAEQARRILEGITKVIARGRKPKVVVLSGSGEFLAARAAASLGAREVRLSRELGEKASAAAAAHALRILAAGGPLTTTPARGPPGAAARSPSSRPRSGR